MNDDKRELLRYTEAYIRDDGDDALRFRFRWKRNGKLVVFRFGETLNYDVFSYSITNVFLCRSRRRR